MHGTFHLRAVPSGRRRLVNRRFYTIKPDGYTIRSNTMPIRSDTGTPSNFARLIARYCEIRSMTQAEVAERGGIRQATVSEIINGKRHALATTVNALKIALDIPGDEVEAAFEADALAAQVGRQAEEALHKETMAALAEAIVSGLQIDLGSLTSEVLSRLRRSENVAPEAAAAAKRAHKAREEGDNETAQAILTDAVVRIKDRIV